MKKTSKKKNKLTSRDLDAAFDRGEDISNHLDKSSSRRINLGIKRVNIDFPAWVIESLDKEARRLGVTRQSLVKMWIAEKFDHNKSA